jgi:hypothetical protein
MKWILNDAPVSWDKTQGIFPSVEFFPTTPGETDCHTVAATEWTVEGNSRDEALEHLEVALNELTPDGYAFTVEGEGLVLVPDSITVADVDKWVNTKPQASRYGNMGEETLTDLLRHVQETAQDAADEDLANHHGIAINCKLNTYTRSQEFKKAVEQTMGDFSICDLVNDLTDKENERIVEAVIDFEDKQQDSGNYSCSEFAMESGWDMATTIADDIGLDSKQIYSAGRSGGYMILPLSRDTTEWNFDSIMQYSIMAWEIAGYKKGGFEYDYAWQVCSQFEGSDEEKKLATEILSERIGHDLSDLKIC